MRYVVLLRYGLGEFRPVLKIDRSQEGHIRCWETVEPFTGMTWSMDGSFEWTSDATGEHRSHREPLSEVREPRVAYSIPGPKLLDTRVPEYTSDIDQGATVQISAHAVLEEPHRVALQLILVPRGEEPYHRETVGDRRIDDGDPDCGSSSTAGAKILSAVWRPHSEFFVGHRHSGRRRSRNAS